MLVHGGIVCQVHWAKFPLGEEDRLDALQNAGVFPFWPTSAEYFQDDAYVDDAFSNYGQSLRNSPVLRCKTHFYMLDAGTVLRLRSKITISPPPECCIYKPKVSVGCFAVQWGGRKAAGRTRTDTFG